MIDSFVLQMYANIIRTLNGNYPPLPLQKFVVFFERLPLPFLHASIDVKQLVIYDKIDIVFRSSYNQEIAGWILKELQKYPDFVKALNKSVYEVFGVSQKDYRLLEVKKRS